MLNSRASTRLSRGILLRARLEVGGTIWRRTFSASVLRQQQPLQSTQQKESISSHITDSSSKEIAFKHVSDSTATRPGFTSRIKIELNRGPATFDSIFLRDACKCPSCVDPSTSQKAFQTADIPSDIEGSCQITDTLEEANLAVINWRNDIAGFPEGHQTALSLEFLEQALEDENKYRTKEYAQPARVIWDKKTMHRDNVYFDYNDYLGSDQTLYRNQGSHSSQSRHCHDA